MCTEEIMESAELSFDVFLRVIIPFGAANIFLMVLIYFTVVKVRLGDAYPFYVIFIVSFIVFLCGPLVNLLPIESTKLWFDIFRNLLLFSCGIPALLFALLKQTEIIISKPAYFLPFILGGTWSVFFLLSPPVLSLNTSDKLYWLPFFINLTSKDIYLSQIILIILLLVLPSLFLLTKKRNRYVTIHIYGVLTLAVFMFLGLLFMQWQVYYAGSSITAFIWCWAVYKDIQQTNNRIKSYQAHQKSFAKAQFSSSIKVHFTEYYPENLNENYPFKERTELLDVIVNSKSDNFLPRLFNLQKALKSYTQSNCDIYRVRVKEVLFMIFDSFIFSSGNSNALLKKLEVIGGELDQSNSIESIDVILLHEVKMFIVEELPCTEVDFDVLLIDKIKKYILSHYHQDISIKDITQQVGASRSHIMKVFKKLTEITINQYLVEVRINKSKTLLLSKSVTATAFEVGFNNSAYFSTVFKKQVGLTPKEYQQSV